MYKLQIAKMMHHINNQNNTGTWTINNSIKLEKLHNHNMRASSQYNFFIPNIRTNLGKSLSAFAGAQIWHEVPSNDQISDTLQVYQSFSELILTPIQSSLATIDI